MKEEREAEAEVEAEVQPAAVQVDSAAQGALQKLNVYCITGHSP